MADDPEDFWPDDIAVDALSPAMILNQQADILARKTKGLIQGELVLEKSENILKLYFDLVAPAASFRHRLLVVRYLEGTVYPAVLTATRQTNFPPNMVQPASSWGVTEEEVKRSRLAYSPADFERIFRIVIGSNRAKASILSLIAKSNEIKTPPKVIYNYTIPPKVNLLGDENENEASEAVPTESDVEDKKTGE